jgi:hypothetical protein
VETEIPKSLEICFKVIFGFMELILNVKIVKIWYDVNALDLIYDRNDRIKPNSN